MDDCKAAYRSDCYKMQGPLANGKQGSKEKCKRRKLTALYKYLSPSQDLLKMTYRNIWDFFDFQSLNFFTG
jgi:hypothetical protein